MGCFNKFALFVINFLVFGVGVAVVVVASIVISKDNTYGTLLSQGVFSLPIIILIAGLVILIIGFLGCCGALKENSCMLQTYAVIMLLLLIAEIVLGILILVYTNKAENVVMNGMDDVFNKYGGKDTSLTKSIDAAQHELKCCGVRNYTDWKNYSYGIDHPNSVSDGCCKEQSEDCGKGILTNPNIESLIYTEGCYFAIKDDIEGLAIGLGVIVIILAIIQLMSISCACGIAKRSKHHSV
ncbi:Tetraspanin-9 [Halocaridina rubra]|uniref:Tetraspanin n=1 Tax=Halocaridina rubra TaxID=373956 RepID=A0AAN8XWP5_HALRR